MSQQNDSAGYPVFPGYLLIVRSSHSCCRAASSEWWELMCVLGVMMRGGWGGLRPVTLCEVMICVAHSFLDHVQVNVLYLWLPLSREVIIVYSLQQDK